MPFNLLDIFLKAILRLVSYIARGVKWLLKNEAHEPEDNEGTLPVDHEIEMEERGNKEKDKQYLELVSDIYFRYYEEHYKQAM